MAKLKSEKKENDGRCYFCNKQTDFDHFCYGCGQYVCDDCSLSDPVGFHTPEEHSESDDEDEDEYL